MKKTLAAVLAAAMALSTASVVFASNTDVDIDNTVWGVTSDTSDDVDQSGIRYGKDIDGILAVTGLTAEQIGQLYDDNLISITTTVTEGRAKLSSSPSVTLRKKGDDKVVRIRFKVADTYGTGSTTVALKVRINFKKNLYAIKNDDGDVTGFTSTKPTDWEGDPTYEKGDTLTTNERSFKIEYGEIDYNNDMQVSIQDVDDRIVKYDASDLYDEIGNDTFTIAFEDAAIFEAKASSAQKDLNLYYSMDEITDITNEYPNVDFEFIDFKGKPSFVNSGTMTFNAIGGRSTTVYTFDGETLEPLSSTYDSSYGTVAVKGVKTLGTFVVASEVLEVEEEEDNEPVSSAPIVEEPSSSEPITIVEKNPSTGAC